MTTDTERTALIQHKFDLIVKQYLAMAEKVAKEDGRGISVFQYITPKDGAVSMNCKYNYFPYNTPHYVWLKMYVPNFEKYDEKYRDSEHFMIIVLINSEDTDAMHDARKWADGKLGLFEFDTRREVCL